MTESCVSLPLSSMPLKDSSRLTSLCSGPIFAELNKLAEDSDLRQEEEQQPPQFALPGQSQHQQGVFGQQAGSAASHTALDLDQVSMLICHVLTACQGSHIHF